MSVSVLCVLCALAVSIAQSEASCLFVRLHYLGNVFPWNCRMKGRDGNEEGAADDGQTSKL